MNADIQIEGSPLLKLLLVGQFQVELDNQVVDLGYNKVRALLAYLVIDCDQAHSRDELAALLWPDSSEIAARKSLRQALTRLRGAIRDDAAEPPFLLVNRETLRINPQAQIVSDVFEFNQLIAACAAHAHTQIGNCLACMERMARVVALYKGDLLKNFTIPDSLPFEEWLLFTRERMRLQVIDVLGYLIAGFERSADDEATLQYSRRRLTVDPYNEDATRSLMRVMARRGQRTAALAEFERCKRVLSEELGIEPSAETAAVYERIRAENGAHPMVGDAESRAQPRPALPAPLTALLGREKETTALLELLRKDSVRLVTLMGPPGIGKTRLSMHIAGLLNAEFDENVYFISLAGISNPALCLPTIGQALGLSGGGQSALEPLIGALKERPALLVLDTFERVLEAAPLLSELLQACPRLKLLVTARAPLHLRGEQRFVLGPLALPEADCLPETLFSAAEKLRPAGGAAVALPGPAVALFVERVQAVLPEFSLTRKNAAIVAAICSRLDGLPLAIELAAASIRLMSPQRLLEQLSGASGSVLQILKERTRDGAAHHQTLRQAFQWSYDLLSADEQVLFARLGVFASGWTLEAAEAVCNVGDIEPGMDGTAALLDNCLIQQTDTSVGISSDSRYGGRDIPLGGRPLASAPVSGIGSDGEYRFNMLVTLREFALDQLNARGELDILRQRHADYFLTFAKLAEPELTGLNQIDWLERVEKDLDNLRAALDWTLRASPEQALELAAALFPFWHVRSYLAEGRAYMEAALAKDLVASPLKARVQAAAGLLAQRQGDFERAGQLVAASVQLCRALDDRRGLAYALNNQAIVHMSLGENEQALHLAEESMKLCQTLHFPLGVARAQMLTGQIALNEDRLADARQSLEISLTFWRRVGDLKNVILCLINLGRVRTVQGNFTEASVQLEESLKLSRKVKDRHWEMVALWNLAEIYLRQGNPSAGLPLLSGCLEQAGRLGDRYFEAMTLNRLGMVAICQGEAAAAEEPLKHSLELGRQMGSQWIVADALGNLGYAAVIAHNWPSAEDYLKESLALFLKQGERSSLVTVLEHLGLCAWRQGQAQAAAQMLAFASQWRLQNGEPLPPVFAGGQAQALSGLRSALSPVEWEKAVGAGQEMNFEQAADFSVAA